MRHEEYTDTQTQMSRAICTTNIPCLGNEINILVNWLFTQEVVYESSCHTSLWHGCYQSTHAYLRIMKIPEDMSMQN